MFVEFVGAPGSGKSTLVPLAVELLRGRGVCAQTVDDAVPLCALRTPAGKIVSSAVRQPGQEVALWRVYNASKAYYRFRFALAHGPFWRYVLGLQRARPISRADRRLVQSYLGRIMGLYQFLSSHLQPGEGVVLDEGFAHRVIHFVSDAEPPRPDEIRHYVELMPTTDLVIVVRVPIGVSVGRVWDRGLAGRLAGKSRAEVTRFVENSAQAIDIAVGDLRRMGRAIVQVQNDSDLDSAEGSLKDQLDTFLAHPEGLVQPAEQVVASWSR